MKRAILAALVVVASALPALAQDFQVRMEEVRYRDGLATTTVRVTNVSGREWRMVDVACEFRGVDQVLATARFTIERLAAGASVDQAIEADVRGVPVNEFRCVAGF